jgi:hypothetical protein
VRRASSLFSATASGNHEVVLDPPTDNDASSVRLTFPAGGSNADLNVMVLAGGAEALGLEPAQAADLRVALAAESAGAFARHPPDEGGEVSIELDCEGDGRRLSLTRVQRTSTNSTRDAGGAGWSDPAVVEPNDEIAAEFAGTAFVDSILPRVFARVAQSAAATLDGVTRSALLGTRLAAAALEAGALLNLEVRVHGVQGVLEIEIRASSDGVLSAMAAAWPAAAEIQGAGTYRTLTLKTQLPAL